MIVADKNGLLAALDNVSRVAKRNATRPILSAVHVSNSGDGTLTLSCTDLEIGIIDVAICESDTQQDFAVHAETLKKHLAMSPAKEIRMIFEDKTLVVEDGESVARFPLLPAEDFPSVNSYYPIEETVVVNAGVLAEIFQLVRFAASKEEKKYAVHGVFIKIFGNEIELATTDASRLAVATGRLKKEVPEEKSAIIPLQAADEIRRMAAAMNPDSAIRFAITGNQIIVKGTHIISAQLIEGSFPPYDEVIPESKHSFTVDRAEFARILRRAELLSNADTNTVTLDISDHESAVIARSAITGSGKFTCWAEKRGPDVKLGVNPSFLLEFFRVITDDAVRIQYDSGDRPIKITDGDRYCYVIMPRRQE